MRYQFIDSQHIQAIKYITHAGRRIANPPDALVDELQLGYAYDPSDSPNIGNEMVQTVTHEYVLDAGVIRDIWTMVEETT